MRSEFRFGANYRIVGKTSPDKVSYAGAWEVAEGTMQALAQHIAKGHPWMPALIDGDRKRKQSNSNWAEVLGADIDDGMTIEEALKKPIIARYCGLGIESSSSQPGHPKFRLVFRLSEPLTNWQDIRIANQFLINSLGCADGACKDASRFFFGAEAKQPFLLNEDATLPPTFWEKAKEWHAEQEATAQKQYEEALAKRALYAAKNDQQGASDDVWVALTHIPPYTPGSGTYEGLRAMITGVVNTLGAEGESLLRQWDAGRGKWGRPFERLIESLKKSNCARPASLASLFYLAKQYGYAQPRKAPSYLPPSSMPDASVQVQASDSELTPTEVAIVRSARAQALKDLVVASAGLDDPFEKAVARSDLSSRYRLRSDEINDLQAEIDARPRNEPQQIRELYSSYLDRICSGNTGGYSLGISSLDRMLGDIHPNDLVIVAGRPAMGKTAFLQLVIKQFCSTFKLPCLLFSVEMAKDQLMDRIISDIGNIPGQVLRQNQVSEDVFSRVTDALEEVSEWDLIIDDNSSIDLPYLLNTANEEAMKLEREGKRLGCILVDYIQLVEGEGENVAAALSKISRNLKALARRLKIPVIALSQLSRAVESRSDKRPLLSDLRESGGLEQDADQVVMLYRDEYYNESTPYRGECELLVRKNRHGPVGSAKVLFDPEHSRFSPIPIRPRG